ncbi:protein of unknown function [Azospirillum baldaniorum]|uniref:Uncharacterized protein n=1 Tax=Azospirillum baldaniorum TaxID=1064539 RepID=A0A9P1JPQ4_9PROT|nr:protein of unknown function [Azospirillum baldaniorum]
MEGRPGHAGRGSHTLYDSPRATPS